MEKLRFKPETVFLIAAAFYSGEIGDKGLAHIFGFYETEPGRKLRIDTINRATIRVAEGVRHAEDSPNVLRARAYGAEASYKLAKAKGKDTPVMLAASRASEKAYAALNSLIKERGSRAITESYNDPPAAYAEPKPFTPKKVRGDFAAALAALYLDAAFTEGECVELCQKFTGGFLTTRIEFRELIDYTAERAREAARDITAYRTGRDSAGEVRRRILRTDIEGYLSPPPFPDARTVECPYCFKGLGARPNMAMAFGMNLGSGTCLYCASRFALRVTDGEGKQNLEGENMKAYRDDDVADNEVNPKPDTADVDDAI